MKALLIYKVSLPADLHNYDQYNECVVAASSIQDAIDTALQTCENFEGHYLVVQSVGTANKDISFSRIISASRS